MSAVNSMALDGHFARVGPAAASLKRVWELFWSQTRVPAASLELCRLTLARLHDDQDEIAAINDQVDPGAVSEEKRGLVLAGKAMESAAFTDEEKALILFAEYYWLDVSAIPEDAANEVRKHVGDGGRVILCEALGLIDGRIRAARCLRDYTSRLNA